MNTDFCGKCRICKVSTIYVVGSPTLVLHWVCPNMLTHDPQALGGFRVEWQTIVGPICNTLNTSIGALK